MKYDRLKFWPEESLKEHSTNVEVFDQALKETVSQMHKVLHQFRGIGIAAPQVGLNKKIFLVDLNALNKEEAAKCGYERPLTFINPVITNLQGESEIEEGCLSFPGVTQKVKRSAELTVSAQDVDGNFFEVNAKGIYATVIQHENEHLYGVTLYHHMSSLKRDIAKRKMQKFQKMIGNK